MAARALGKSYRNGETIVRQGEVGDCMYVIEAGEVEVVHESGDEETRLAVLGAGDFFGEMAVFDRAQRSATVRALGDVQALTIDKTTFLRRISQDPTLAFRVVQKMSHRIRELNAELARFKGTVSGID
jgi:CRP-like cAMP-binding protein